MTTDRNFLLKDCSTASLVFCSSVNPYNPCKVMVSFEGKRGKKKKKSKEQDKL